MEPVNPINPEPLPTVNIPQSQENPKKGKPVMLLVKMLLFIIALVLVAFVAYYLGTKSISPVSPVPSITPCPSATPISEAPLTYSDDTYGFTLDFPGTWKNFQVSNNPGPDPRIVTITVPDPSSDALPIGSLNIYMFTKAEWNSHPKKPHYITENSDYIFATDPFITTDAECVQLDSFQCDRSLEVPSIIDTFKLN